MGTILVEVQGAARAVMLAQTTLLGRHWSCGLVIDRPEVPLYWLEVRWMGGHWAWRAINQQDETRAAGHMLGNGWRHWRRGAKNTRRVRLGSSIELQLTDDGPPVPLMQCLHTKDRFALDELPELVTLNEDGVFLSQDEPGLALEDGALIQAEDRAYFLWLPNSWSDTNVARLVLGHPEGEVSIDLSIPVVRFSQGAELVEVRGEPARLLYVYAAARLEQGVDGPGGWLTTAEAFDDWIAAGGKEDSPRDRLHWERARLSTRLVQAGVGKVSELFERRRRGKDWEIRLKLSPDRIALS